jgi:ring-1,2-phenylacetyl-CoA epoxidase subunit PaaC
MADRWVIESAEQAKQNPQFLTALKELLFQLGDDEFILSYRASEWLGLAPHIEADVAFSSMAQDMMGHAVMFYDMLSELGEATTDELAHLRNAEAFRNAVLVERANGRGTYLDDPHFDWAYAVVRNYIYGIFKTVRLQALCSSSYQPLIAVARKMMKEHHYHSLHWKMWLDQLANSTDEAKARIHEAIKKVWEDVSGLFLLGANAAQIVESGLIEKEEIILTRWLEKVKSIFEANGLEWPGKPAPAQLDGRTGIHTIELVHAIETLSEVYRMDPAANW